MNHFWFCFVELYLNAKYNFMDQKFTKKGGYHKNVSKI